MNSFIDSYFSYIGETEAPMTFHRWAAITILGAWIGSDYCFRLGHFNIKPNIYCMLMGDAGSRKSTAIKIAARFIAKAGYRNVAADRSTKEKFLLDLAGIADDVVLGRDGKVVPLDLDSNLFSDLDTDPTPETLIAADEFNNFVGNGNIEFLSMLGGLWDHEGPYKNKVKNSKSVELMNPFVSILAGNTATGFSLAFPIESIGQGIFSRILLVHGESTGKKITFPDAPSAHKESELIAQLHAIKHIANRQAGVSDKAKLLLDAIYKGTGKLDDVRFESYHNRRFPHLIKLCLVLSAASLRATIEEEDVVRANTVLTHAEHGMPKALGEFGKSKNSDVSHKLIQILENSFEPMTLKQLWMQLHNDLDDVNKLRDMIHSLELADKLMSTKGGILAKRKVMDEVAGKYVDFSMLTEEERRFVK